MLGSERVQALAVSAPSAPRPQAASTSRRQRGEGKSPRIQSTREWPEGSGGTGFWEGMAVPRNYGGRLGRMNTQSSEFPNLSVLRVCMYVPHAQNRLTLCGLH